MANITLLHYNNYFNRTIKVLDTVAEYKAADTEGTGQQAVAHYLDISGTNFVPGDGVTTSHVFGTSSLVMDFDYLIVTHTDTSTTPATEVIDSRWFILEENRTRDGQYELVLRRDVIADHYDETLNATTYVEKGNVQVDNPLLFNKEGLLLNQIKTDEILLKDKSNCPWIVGYIAKDAYTADTTINYNPANHDYIEVAAATINDWEYKEFDTNNFLGTIDSSSFTTRYQAGEWWIYNWAGYATITGGAGKAWGKENGSHNWALRGSWWLDRETVANQLLNAYINLGFSKLNQSLYSLIGAHQSAKTNDFLSYNNKVIKTQDGKFYKIKIVSTGTEEKTNGLTSGNALWNLMTSAAQSCGAFTNGYTTPDNDSFTYSYKCKTYKMNATELFNQNVTTKISSTHEKSKDALYDMFCMPYGAIKIGTGSGISYNPEFTTNEEASIAAATALAIAMGGGSGTDNKIYDLQLLPYCPVQTQIVDEGQLTIAGMSEHTNFEYIYDNSTNPATKIGILYYIPNGNFTFDVTKSIDYERFAFISSFTDISIPGGWTATLNNYQDYVITTLATPQSIIDLGPAWIDDNGYYNITALETNPSRYTNGIVFKKIHKTSGAILEQYDCSKLEVHMCTNSSNNDLKVYKFYNDVQVVQETITKTAYDNADYYIAYQITSEAYGGRGIDPCWAVISKIPIYNYEVSEATALKLDNECNMYRLISPNYQGEFEFSVAKNNGVDFFNVDCTYKPYNPYIHVNPNFKGLYGKDFNDGRGLICNGDFSFGMISDAFTNYELSNKNYQAVFNRQIQNMDVEQGIQKQEATVGMVTGVVQGTATGAAAGAMVGGGYGAIAGAVVGAATSTVGGVMDLINLEKRQKEQKSFAIDMYNYSLQNIHALSYTLTRCTALTYNNKLVPFVEKWTCTSEEKEALLEKLHYDGMTVNKIGRIADYIGNDTMVRGEIIRFNDGNLKADAHMANAIFDEIRKGVYL